MPKGRKNMFITKLVKAYINYYENIQAVAIKANKNVS